MEAAGGQPALAINVLAVNSLPPLSLVVEKMTVVAIYSITHSFRNLKPILA